MKISKRLDRDNDSALYLESETSDAKTPQESTKRYNFFFSDDILHIRVCVRELGL